MEGWHMAGKRRFKGDQAVAVRYDERTDTAPRIVAKGHGAIAARIREIAQTHGIPLHRDDDLVELLGQVDIDREIPPELYAAMAEVLSWIYRAGRESAGERTS